MSIQSADTLTQPVRFHAWSWSTVHEFFSKCKYKSVQNEMPIASMPTTKYSHLRIHTTMSLPVQNLKDLNLSSIKNIIFDLGNVLLRVNQDGTRQAFEALGARRPSAFQNMSNVVNNFQKGRMRAHDFRKTIRSTIGLSANVPDIEFDRAWSAPLLDFPRGRLGLVRAARNVYEYNIYLLSNTDAILTERVNEIVHEGHTEDSLLPFFDRVFYSHETGHLKPDEQSFQQILREQNLVPGETLFIDDSPINVEAARSCGLQSIVVNMETDLLPLLKD